MCTSTNKIDRETKKLTGFVICLIGRCIQKNDEITATLEHNHSPDAAAIEVNCLHVLSFLMRMLYIVREIFHNCQLCLSLWMCIESSVSVTNELKLKFSVFHIPLLGNALSVSVDECRRLFYFFVGVLSSLSAVVSVSWLSANISCRRVVMSASCLSVSCHRFILMT